MPSPSSGHGAVCRGSPRASTAASHLMGIVNFNMCKWDLVPSAPKAVVFLQPDFLPSINDPTLLIQVPEQETRNHP